MVGRKIGSLFIFLLVVSLARPSSAALDSVSGRQAGLPAQLTAITSIDPPALVAYSLANGFPVWFQDASGLKLQLCLDQAVEKAGGGIFFPCFLGNPAPGSPVSFPFNFGAEAFWYASNAFRTYVSRQGGALVEGGDMLFRGDLEAAFAGNLGAIDGDQVAFSRIRLRISVPRPGIYRVIHPYGTFDYTITDPGRRAINQTQDIGNFDTPGAPPSGNFTLALPNGPPPPAEFDPFDNAGVVDIAGRGIGPFLRPAVSPGGAQLPFIQAVNGDRYLSDPGIGAIHLEVPVTGSLTGDNVFSLELLHLLEPDDLDNLVEVDPASVGFFLNAENNSQRVVVDRFQLMGKLFDDRPNTAPVAEPVVVSTPRNTLVAIDVAGSVHDEIVAGANEYGIHPQALGLPTNPSNLLEEILLTRPLTTAAGGRVERVTPINTGRSVFQYSPPSADFTGEDYFHYVVQDHGGLISEPARVTVIVEDLQAHRAEYRPRLGKWRVEGTSSRTENNVIEVKGAPHAVLSGERVRPNPVTTGARGRAALAPASDRIDFTFSIDPLPATPVFFATIHIAAPGQESGPSVFFIFDDILHGAFSGTFSGTITPQTLIERPAIGVRTFADVLDALLGGRAYLNVYTQQYGFGGGELRGDIELALIGTADVVEKDGSGMWVFEGKSEASPGPYRQVNIRSSGGVRVMGLPLQLR